MAAVRFFPKLLPVRRPFPTRGRRPPTAVPPPRLPPGQARLRATGCSR